MKTINELIWDLENLPDKELAPKEFMRVSCTSINACCGSSGCACGCIPKDPWQPLKK